MSRVDEMIDNGVRAAVDFRRFDQEKTDRIVRAVFLAAFEQRVKLAKMAHEETGIGIWTHKVIKNVIATQLVYNNVKSVKTVGVISQDFRLGVVEIAQPVGVILALIPVTNPTATVFFKCLIAMKSRNSLIISPHNAARRCTAEAVRICYEAALSAGAPEHCIQWLKKSTPRTTSQLMKHRELSLIIATGTGGLVREAYSSGTPVIGVGPGNVPVYIGATADIPFAVRSILESKTFDNGSVCASEQAIVVKKAAADRVIEEFKAQKAYFMKPEETEAVGKIAFDPERSTMTPTIVGQSTKHIARSAGFDVPEDTTVLIGKLDGVGRDYPLSAEILAPILAFYIEEDFDASIERCSEITQYGGAGHTAVIYSNRDERIEYFSRVIDAGRILVNMPSTQGALGGIFNSLDPSFTLACGSRGNNTSTDNITARHLLNIHRITRRRPNPRWSHFEHSKFLDDSLPPETLEGEYNKNF
jgi:acetaldehyde dehydrogenase/alcohol dehydrogenase